MRKFFVSATMFAVFGVLNFALAAQAKQIRLTGTYSQSQIRAACAAAGGTSWDSGNRYGCVNEARGTSVDCSGGSGQCRGEVPDLAGPSSTTMGGVLAGRPTPVQGGILDNPRGLPSQGPAATGALGMPRPTASGAIIR
jgi:hypothetical protein